MTIMDLDWTSIVISFTTLLLVFIMFRNDKNLPPGPFAIPLLGSVGILKQTRSTPSYKVFADAGRVFGGIISVWIGPSLIVVINGCDALNQFLVKQGSDFVDKPNWMPQLTLTLKDGLGVMYANGDEWTFMRKLTLQSFRNFGVGQGTIEEKIIEEGNVIINEFQNQKGNYKNIEHTLQYLTTNVISSVICGQRFDYKDKTFIELVETFGTTIKGQGYVSNLVYLPTFMHPWFRKEYNTLLERKDAFVRSKAIIMKLIDTHEETFDENNIRDFIDACIQVSRDEKKYLKKTYLKKDNIFKLIFDTFQAGAQTTSAVLNWALLYMIEYPEIQTKCREVIKDMVGDRTVHLADRPNLPYINAVLQEVLRLSNVVPLGGPRTNADRDVIINGHTIPKRTIIIPNLYSSHMDPKYWDEPEIFRPERFIDAGGKLVSKHAFMPSSAGPRNCLGEALSRNEMFLLFSNFLQLIEFKRTNESVRHDFSTKPENLITLLPKPYELKICAL